MMSKLYNQHSAKKVEFIKALFKRYQPTLEIAEQLALLDMWIGSCVEAQEFEMASALLREKRYIINNVDSVPMRLSGEPMALDDDQPLFSYRTALNLPMTKNEETSIYSKIMIRIKKFLKWRN